MTQANNATQQAWGTHTNVVMGPMWVMETSVG